MKFIDLFAGIGGFRSGLEKNGHKAIAFSEVDKHAKQSYTAIYDTSEELDLGDITKVSNEQWKNLKEKTNIIVGGSPCQSFSLAGKRRGFEDTRGTLFFHYVNAVKEVQPEFFIFENVKGMISHDKGETIKTVLSSFNEIGYDIDFDIFNSKYYGVPQNRERIYIVGKRKDLGLNESRKPINGKKRLDQLKNWATENINYVRLLPENNNKNVEKKLLDVLEETVDEKFYLSHEQLKNLIIEEEGQFKIKEATKQGYAIAKQGDSVNVSFPESKTRHGRVGKQLANTLQAGEVNQGVIIKNNDSTSNYYSTDNVLYDECQYKKLVKENNDFEYDYVYIEPTEIHLDKEHILLVNNEQNQYEIIEIKEGYYLSLEVAASLEELKLAISKREFGRFGKQAIDTLNENISVVKDGNVINAYNKTLDKSGLSPTLTTRPEGFKTAILPVTNDLRIRKLTPLECWRLQGFEDQQFNKAQENGVSNSQLYKQAGNAVTVNVVDTIVKELKKHGLK